MSFAETDVVRVKRRLAATPELVFACWVDAASLESWLAPHAAADGRPGGSYRLTVSKGDVSHVVSGEYREFVPGKRLVMTWVYDGPMAPEGKMEALLTVDFHGDVLSTELSLVHERLTSPQYRDAIQQGAWTQALDKLEAHLKENDRLSH